MLFCVALERLRIPGNWNELDGLAMFVSNEMYNCKKEKKKLEDINLFIISVRSIPDSYAIICYFTYYSYEYDCNCECNCECDCECDYEYDCECDCECE